MFSVVLDYKTMSKLQVCADWSRPSRSSHRLPVLGSVQSDLTVGPDRTEPYSRPGPSGLVESLPTTSPSSPSLSSPSPSPPSPSSPSAPDRMHTHTPTIDGKRAADFAGKSESEIGSPQDPILYHSCGIYGYNCQHHDREAL
jgi:hypothetical protein